MTRGPYCELLSSSESGGVFWQGKFKKTLSNVLVDSMLDASLYSVLCQKLALCIQNCPSLLFCASIYGIIPASVPWLCKKCALCKTTLLFQALAAFYLISSRTLFQLISFVSPPLLISCSLLEHRVCIQISSSICVCFKKFLTRPHARAQLLPCFLPQQTLTDIDTD